MTLKSIIKMLLEECVYVTIHNSMKFIVLRTKKETDSVVYDKQALL